MKPITQSEIEKKMEQSSKNKFDPHHMEEWTLNLGKRRALFHPTMKQWLWLDNLHQEWVLAGCSAGEAVLMSYQNMGGMKKIPQPGPVDNWCVFWSQNAMHTPILITDLYENFMMKAIPPDLKIWSTRAIEWLNVKSTPDHELNLTNNVGETILNVNSHGQFSV